MGFNLSLLFLVQIFALNAKLASAESMTHDVIRDLLGVKLDMTTCVVSSSSILAISLSIFHKERNR